MMNFFSSFGISTSLLRCALTNFFHFPPFSRYFTFHSEAKSLPSLLVLLCFFPDDFSFLLHHEHVKIFNNRHEKFSSFVFCIYPQNLNWKWYTLLYYTLYLKKGKLKVLWDIKIRFELEKETKVGIIFSPSLRDVEGEVEVTVKWGRRDDTTTEAIENDIKYDGGVRVLCLLIPILSPCDNFSKAETFRLKCWLLLDAKDENRMKRR